ncbi:MAG: hypothetical protein M1825_001443 [Sarcosagium campestre]|nr:MAG: hypothetical protein M1825_001443 [Sarcosagium campestre]
MAEAPSGQRISSQLQGGPSRNPDDNEHNTIVAGDDTWKDWMQLDDDANPLSSPGSLHLERRPPTNSVNPDEFAHACEVSKTEPASQIAVELPRQVGDESSLSSPHEFLENSGRASLDTMYSAESVDPDELSMVSDRTNGYAAAPQERINGGHFLSVPQNRGGLARKSSEGKQRSSGSKNSRWPKKTAHNVVEKRYRVNLNGKIAALRDSVPSLRLLASKSQPNADDEDDEDDIEGHLSAQRLNKSTILTKAAEYIAHLEKRNRRLEDENGALQKRISEIERLAMTGSLGIRASSRGKEENDEGDEPKQSDTKSENEEAPQGMIRVPENIRRFYAGQSQQHYAVRTAERHGHGRKGATKKGNQDEQGGASFVNKLMVGSLAGLL